MLIKPFIDNSGHVWACRACIILLIPSVSLKSSSINVRLFYISMILAEDTFLSPNYILQG